MSDTFEVPVESVDVLAPSTLTSNLVVESGSAEILPVLFDDEVYYFHEANGGYDKRADQYHVGLVHKVQGDGSPPNDPSANRVEIHTPEHVYTFEVSDIHYWDRDYPSEDYALSLVVDEYMRSEYTFHEELQADIDEREQEFSYNE